MVYKSGQIFLPFCQGSRVWWTDGRTDGQTEFSSLDRVCIACSAVKTGFFLWGDGAQFDLVAAFCFVGFFMLCLCLLYSLVSDCGNRFPGNTAKFWQDGWSSENDWKFVRKKKVDFYVNVICGRPFSFSLSVVRCCMNHVFVSGCQLKCVNRTDQNYILLCVSALLAGIFYCHISQNWHFWEFRAITAL